MGKITYVEILCPLAGKSETMGVGEASAPSLLVFGAAVGRRSIARGSWMGTGRQALPPVEQRPETARRSPL